MVKVSHTFSWDIKMLEAQTMDLTITMAITITTATKGITITTMDNLMLLKENENGKGKDTCPYKPKATSKRFL